MNDRRRTALILVFVSGGVALGCEAAWFRSLTLLLGATLPASGALLAAFMAGLALGADLGARLADRIRAPGRAYAVAEALVALFSLVSSRAFELVRASVGSEPLTHRIAAACAFLLLPTCAMGATLPLLAASTITARSDLRRGLSELYASNLLGGAAGAAFAGFILLPRLGLVATTRLLGTLGLGVAIVALTLDGVIDRTDAAPHRGDSLTPALAALLGTISFALQICWNRAFAQMLGSASYTFALVLAVIVASTALGGRASREPESDAVFWPGVARRAVTLGIASYLGVLIVQVAPFYLVALASHGVAMVRVRVALVTLIVGVPSYQVGALFPMLASRFPARAIGRATGGSLAATTAGNVCGAVVGAFVLVPRFGVQSTWVLLSGAAMILALIAASRAGRQHLRGVALACATGMVLASVAHPRWDPIGMSAGTFRTSAYRATLPHARSGCGPDRYFPERRVLFEREGATGSVVVLGLGAGAECSLYSLRINGKAEGSVFVAGALQPRITRDAVRFATGDLPTEVLAGWLPGMAGAAPSSALLVGWGTGISARALVETGASHLLAVEIEPAVFDAARIFDAALLIDRAVTLRVDDAHVALRQASPGAFDVIASHPSNPWVRGAASLFSREYFALVRSRLREGGRAMAWIQLYDSDVDVVRGIVATFVTAFPDVHAFAPDRGARDLLLLGMRTRDLTTREALWAQFALRTSAASRAQLAIAGMPDLASLGPRYLADPSALARFARGGRVNTEDNSWVEFRIADHLLTGDGTPPEQILAAIAGDARDAELPVRPRAPQSEACDHTHRVLGRPSQNRGVQATRQLFAALATAAPLERRAP